MPTDQELQLQLAVAALGAAFAKALVAHEPSFLRHLKAAVLEIYHELVNRGDAGAAVPLKMLSRYLNDHEEFSQE